MPVKQRRRKARPFDDYRKEQLLCGPDACLLAGVGYLTAAKWSEMSDGEQELALKEMRRDWSAHGPILMAWWDDPEAAPVTSKPWVFPIRTGDLPWAAQQFGEPSCQ